VRAPSGDVYHAIADPRRRKLLDSLLETELPVGALVERSDVSFSAISQHLAVLRDAGLVVSRTEGRSRIYVAAPARLQVVHDWTAQYRAFWRGRLIKLNEYLERHP
jgi:DNA-binding transcriptional ArsR family regulator